MSPEAEDLRLGVARAARVLSALGLVTAYGHVSARAGTAMLITPAADLATVGGATVIEVPLTATALPPGAPAEAWAHLAVYRVRGDAGAIARAQPPGAFAAAAVTPALPVLHGQAAWLGASVPVHDSALLLRSAELAGRASSRLREGEALLLRGNGALTLGAITRDRGGPHVAAVRRLRRLPGRPVGRAGAAAVRRGDRVVAGGPERAAAAAVGAPEPPRRGRLRPRPSK